MLKLERPAHSTKDTFLLCISRIKDPDLKNRMQSILLEIVSVAETYHDAAQNQSLHEVTGVEAVGPVKKKELEALYTQRMAKKLSPGRPIYDDIMASAINGKCPLCAQRLVTTLDHSLPQAHYPSLTVTPLNLVPSCGDCNKAKLSAHPKQAEDVTIHPYYDDLDAQHRWLYAEVIETTPAALSFHIRPPIFWGNLLEHRVRNHFKLLGLSKLYGTVSADELTNIRYQLTRLYQLTGGGGVKKHLEDTAQSCAAVSLNSWRTAAYQAWTNSDWFCEKGFGLVR